MRVVDVNILVNLVNDYSPHCAKLKAWWESALEEGPPIGLAWITLTGFIRIVTSHQILPSPLATSGAITEVSGWLGHPNTRLVTEADNHLELMDALLAEAGRAGDLAPDAHLAAIAIGNGAVLASCDTDFARFSKLRWENPLAVA